MLFLFLSPYPNLSFLFGFYFISITFSCPNHQYAAKCCNDYFTIHRHQRWPSCQTFQYLERCFSLTNCDLPELALVCSREYGRVHHRYLPKQAVLAVYGNLRKECTKFCDEYSNLEKECSKEYEKSSITTLKEQDNAVRAEIRALKGQLHSGSDKEITRRICQVIISNLRLLHSLRYGICAPTAVYCLCRRLEMDLPRTCLFKCDRFKQYNGPNAIDYSNKISAANSEFTSFVQVMVIVVSFVICQLFESQVIA